MQPLWGYRHFIVGAIRNEYRARLVRSRLGGLWMLINPLAQVAIYTLVLSAVISSRLPGGDESPYAYAVYLMAGLLAWTLFSELVNRSLLLFVSNEGLIKKIRFPVTVLPLIAAGSALLANLLLLLAMLAIFLLLGHPMTLHLLWLLPLTALLMAFGLGLGLLLGVINTFVRDVGQAVAILLQLGFWLTPIVYPITILPELYRDWFELNPLYPFVAAYQTILLHGAAPALELWWRNGASALLALLIGLFVLHRASAEMADVL